MLTHSIFCETRPVYQEFRQADILKRKEVLLFWRVPRSQVGMEMIAVKTVPWQLSWLRICSLGHPYNWYVAHFVGVSARNGKTYCRLWGLGALIILDKYKRTMAYTAGLESDFLAKVWESKFKESTKYLTWPSRFFAELYQALYQLVELSLLGM